MIPDGAERRLWTGKRGSLEFIKLAPTVGLVVFRGKVTDDATSVWHQNFSWLIEGGDTQLFFDGGELVHAGVRMAATGIAMITRSRDRIAAAHVLVRNRYVEHMAEAANLSFGGYMQLHRERAAFEAEIERALHL